MLKNLPDGELIKRYLENASEEAFRVLVERHYNRSRQRFLSHCHNTTEADDLTQQLWIRVIDKLDSYHDEGRFPSFLNRISSNLLTDYWRRKGVRDKVIDETAKDDPVNQIRTPREDTQAFCESWQQIEYLVKELIPSLPCEQRMAFLLKHESEYWEGKQRLGWNHIADLNGIDKHTAWSRFERARNMLIKQLLKSGASDRTDLDNESLLIFLVWTQAQRLSKKQEFTWSYFSELLGVSTNTLKTRYRAALKKLSEGLSEQN